MGGGGMLAAVYVMMCEIADGNDRIEVAEGRKPQYREGLDRDIFEAPDPDAPTTERTKDDIAAEVISMANWVAMANRDMK
jgi:hypothetical protein